MGLRQDFGTEALPRLAALARGGRRIAREVRRRIRQHVDLNSARKALLQSEALSRDEKRVLGNVSLRMHPSDDMYLVGTARHYLSVGVSAMRCINAALDHARNGTEVRNILDLPSGFGRILRFLKVAFPNADICGCELVPEAVNFCGKAFRVHTAISNRDFVNILLPGPFDLIWSGSLLTHLDESRAKKLLRLYYRHLAPGGLCVFTMHGQMCIDWLRSGAELYGLTEPARIKLLSEFDDAGYGYGDYESEEGYGISAGVARASSHWRQPRAIGLYLHISNAVGAITTTYTVSQEARPRRR